MRAHPLATDASTAVLATAANLWGSAAAVLAGHHARGPDVLALPLAFLAAAPVALRRRYPVTVATVCGTVYYVESFGRYGTVVSGFVALFTLYSAGAYGGKWRGLGLALAEAAVGIVYILETPALRDMIPVELALVVMAMAAVQFPGVWLIGRAVRTRRMYLQELEDRADRLERTAAAEVRAALAEERTRVARELHDVVAHHVSVMTVQAAAARRTLTRDTERAGEAMRAVEDTGRSALDEMRRIVGALRNAETTADEAGPSGPSASGPGPRPGAAELGALVDRAREAGLRVELSVIGHPRRLPPSVDLAVYRIVQEALTNTLKHAGPTEARVTVRYQPDQVDVAVIDDGGGRRRTASGTPHTGAETGDQRHGHGLIGMRERVHLNGGTLRTGPRATGGYEVSARLPLHDDGAPQSVRDADRSDELAPERADPRDQSSERASYDAVSP